MNLKKFFTGRRNKYRDFLPAAIEVLDTPVSPLGRIILWLLVVFVVIAVIWMSLGKIDEIASSPGQIVPAGYVKTVQSEKEGLVSELLVTDGQVVKKGQILVRLDSKVDSAQVRQLREDLAYYNFAIQSMEALLLDKNFQPERGSYKNLRDEDFQIQLCWYNNKLRTLKAREAMNKSQIEAASEKANADTASKEKLEKLLVEAAEQERRIQKLFGENSSSEFQLFQYREKRISVQQDLASEQSMIAADKAAEQENVSRLMDTKNEFFDDINKETIEYWNTKVKLEIELLKAEREEEKSIVRAPVDGKVAALAVHGAGTVVKEGEPLLTVVPDNTKMYAEVWINNRDIGFVRVGQKADIKVAAFDFQKYGIVTGTVLRISPDVGEAGVARQENAGSTGEPSNVQEKKYAYKAILELSNTGITVDDRQLPYYPGMVVTAEIKTGQRRIIQYFLDTFRRFSNDSLRER